MNRIFDSSGDIKLAVQVAFSRQQRGAIDNRASAQARVTYV